jgi:hypothetical protein
MKLTAQECGDLMLDLRIVQQTQKRLFERLMLLRLGDFALNLGWVIHHKIIA